MKNEIESINSAIDNLFQEGKLSDEFRKELQAAVKKAAVTVINKRYPDSIDPRFIKCACGDPNCQNGISFDSEGDFMILRTHYYLNNEVHMKLTNDERLALIDHLKIAE